MSQSDFTVIFDLDGTLLNTLEDLADALNFTLRELDCPEKSDADVLAAIGKGIKNAIIKLMCCGESCDGGKNGGLGSEPGTRPEPGADGKLEAGASAGPDAETVSRGMALFRKRYEECYLMRTRPYPGIMELLRELRGRGCRIAVISNKADSFTVGLIEKNFGPLVDATAGELPGVPLKPDPKAVLSILSKVGGTPERAVYVGDSEVDIATARNAGLPLILVSWGFRNRDELIRAGADPASFANTAEEVLAKIDVLIEKS